MRDWAKIRKELTHVFWIGGSPCAGKTTMAQVLSREQDFSLYDADTHMFYHHSNSVLLSKYPLIAKAISLAGRYYYQSPGEIMSLTLSYLREEFELVVDDLLSFHRDCSIVAEGICLLPEMVIKAADPVRIVCLVPTDEFYKKFQPQRESVMKAVEQYTDRDQALKNMMEAHLRIAEYIRESAKMLGIQVVVTEKESSVIRHLELIGKQLSSSHPPGG